MQLSAAATGTAAAVSATRPRVTGNVGGGRARTQLRDQIVVLRGLRRSQLEILVLGLEIGQLALREEVQDRSRILVVRVNDVAGCRVDRVASVALLRRHVVAHLRDSRAIFAAAISGLHLHGVELLHESRLLVAAGQLGLCKAVCHCHVGAVDKLRLLVKSVAKTLIYTVDLALDIGKIRGQHVAVYDAAAVAVVPPAAISPTKKCEKKQDNNKPAAFSAPAKTAAVAGIYAFILRNLLTEMLAQMAVMMTPKRKTEPPVMASSCHPITMSSSGSCTYHA